MAMSEKFDNCKFSKTKIRCLVEPDILVPQDPLEYVPYINEDFCCSHSGQSHHYLSHIEPKENKNKYKKKRKKNKSQEESSEEPKEPEKPCCCCCKTQPKITASINGRPSCLDKEEATKSCCCKPQPKMMSCTNRQPSHCDKCGRQSERCAHNNFSNKRESRCMKRDPVMQWLRCTCALPKVCAPYHWRKYLIRNFVDNKIPNRAVQCLLRRKAYEQNRLDGGEAAHKAKAMQDICKRLSTPKFSPSPLSNSLWKLTSSMKNFKPSDRLLQMAEPKNTSKIYAPKNLPLNKVLKVKKAALHYEPSNRILDLAKPKSTLQYEEKDPYWISKNALNAKISDRISQLALPKQRVDRTVRKSPFAVCFHALYAKPSKLTQVLAQPKFSV